MDSRVKRLLDLNNNRNNEMENYMTFKNLEEIKAAPTRKLVEVYNAATKKSIKKFADRKTAETRTAEALGLIEAKTAEKPVKATKEPKVSKAAGKRSDYEHRIINVLVKENPKRDGSRAHKKFAILMEHDGKTVGEYKAKEGKFPTLDAEAGWPATEIRWSINLGLIKLTNGNAETKAA